MFYRIPGEFFVPVVKVDELDFLDCMESYDNLKKETEEKDILKEADDDYLEGEIG